jgi:sugar phosphate isomerase/epimerase
MNRRDFIATAVGSTAASLGMIGNSRGQDGPRATTGMGIAQFSFHLRLRAERDKNQPVCIGDPLCFLKHCHSLGAGGIQAGLGERDASTIRSLRTYAEQHGLFIEGSISLPRKPGDVERFEARMRTAKEAGVTVLRSAIGGRRYEQFETRKQFEAFWESAWQAIQLAEPAAAKQKLHLAIENHKDFRTTEMLTMLERLNSEYVGVCMDTGNSFALLEDPLEVVRAYAPWARAAHLKDMALRECEDGFLLADVPLGEGLLDLPEMVKILKRARPEIRFSLEMATRDPLRVPCLSERYWATFEDLPGADLARTLRYVREYASAQLAEVSPLPLAERIALEERNIEACLQYASQTLNL